ncbi:hypothetical protein WT02_26330 [Burkholderia stagnalis]|nr:hypothetical protein WT02_26330 [Burkholderia stagnalis]KVL99343.1 hypothetical protein WT03_06930 [Burkholderia stagnalis]KVM03000.1 hypothetical protein WT04_28755 [Burkholderia stagnalis]
MIAREPEAFIAISFITSQSNDNKLQIRKPLNRFDKSKLVLPRLDVRHVQQIALILETISRSEIATISRSQEKILDTVVDD